MDQFSQDWNAVVNTFRGIETPPEGDVTQTESPTNTGTSGSYPGYGQYGGWGDPRAQADQYAKIAAAILGDPYMTEDPYAQPQGPGGGLGGLAVGGFPNYDATLPDGVSWQDVRDITQGANYYNWDYQWDPVAQQMRWVLQQGTPGTGSGILGDMAPPNAYQSQLDDQDRWRSSYGPDYYANLPRDYNVTPGTGRGRHRTSDWRTAGHEHGAGRRRRQAQRASA